MAIRWQLNVVALCVLLAAPLAHADIYRWDTGEVIPGTEGIEPGPGVDLSSGGEWRGSEWVGVGPWNTGDQHLGYADFSGGLDLSRASFAGSWLHGADFTEANLTGAGLTRSNLANASLTGAVVTGANFTALTGFTAEQLYSTASYRQKDLRAMDLPMDGLSGWNFSGQDLRDTYFLYYDGPMVNLTGADFSGADLTDTRLSGCVLTNTNLSNASLGSASLGGSTLTNANLLGANLGTTDLYGVTDLLSATMDSSTTYSRWTNFPDDFDPVTAGLTFVLSQAGDMDANNVLTDADVDLLGREVRGRNPMRYNPYWLDDMFDLNADASVNEEDHEIWVKELQHTWYGDANLDGEFNSGDMVQIFGAGKYEEAAILVREDVILNAPGWSQGDWNGDGIFDSSDMVTAFADGGRFLWNDKCH